MKKIYSNKCIIYISFFGIAFFSIATIISLISLFFGIISGKINMVAVYSILLFVNLCFTSLSFLILNRLGCQIIYNENEKILIRKGFICGYKYQLKTEDIRDIIIATFPKETTYFVLLDSVNTKYDGGSKKSFIRIEKIEKNYNFIKQFWDKPMKEYKQYSDLFT